MISARELAVYVVLASCLALFLSCRVEGPSKAFSALKDGLHDFTNIGKLEIKPDFARYQQLRILGCSEFPLDSPGYRLIVVGDIHGMVQPLNKLLATVDYDPEFDTLIHTGDIIAKGPHRDSMAVLSFMARNNITGVRGNHDQQIIEWRGWIKWICSSKDGCGWLHRIESRWERHHKHHKSLSLDDFLDSEKKELAFQDKRWWRLIPSDWQLLGDHYRIAKEMSDEEYHYLIQLPLRLYIPSAHAYVVHAGLLPSDPRYPFNDSKRQPLARIPKLRGTPATDDGVSTTGGWNVERIRNLQEMGILNQIPQNANPWVVLNMRAVKNGEVSRKTKGKHWYKIWADEINHCIGFGDSFESSSEFGPSSKKPGKHSLPCYPASVLYGHMASMGLNIRRWTFGLDSGCVYGRKLSAFVIGEPKIKMDSHSSSDDAGDKFDPEDEDSDADDDDDEDETDTSGKKKPQNGDVFPFGDRYKGQIVTVDCH